ncbi:DUF6650 family protein [Piscicoccus intestinalis]|uniref:DUF6650 family protein n=1 Tax=Piscicoccus intestinalis TaxID=746033 RepID=UPI0012EE52FE|nr:DUF6650 family protein [Piscicoccus intestinalis]
MRYRLTGVSGAAGGIQWEKRDDDREIARRVLNLFGDRRMLWKDFSLEVEEDCVRSAAEIRRELGRHLDNPDIGRDLERQVKVCQGLFRTFMDDVGPSGGHGGRGWGPGTDELSMALGRLRALVGIQVGELAARYNLDVPDDLVAIVPSEAGWFFERFQGPGQID